MASLLGLTCLVLTVSCSVSEDVSSLDSAGKIPRSTLFTLQASSRDTLHGMGLSECRQLDSSKDLCEMVGVPSDHARLVAAGVELIQVQHTSQFASDGYHHPDDLKSEFDKLASRYPDVAQVVDLTKQLKAPTTVNGKSIFALKVSDNVQKDEDQPNALIVSNHHARELITPELTLRAAQSLLEEYHKGDDQAKGIVNGNQVYFVWTMNPDSLQEVWEGNPWIRKNTNGVDLNRNYAVGWDLECGGAKNPDSESYRGPHPFSEPETRTMKMLQKDRNFAKVLDIHSYAKQVRINYGCVDLPSTVHDLFMEHARTVGSAMNYDAAQSCCMGGDIHFAYKQHGSLAFLVEAGGDGFQPGSSQREAILKDMVPGFKQFLGIPISVSGRVTLKPKDGSKPAPLAGAELSVPALKFRLGEVSVTSSTGRYHLWLPEGTFKVKVAFKDADGKDVSKVVELQASKAGEVHDVSIDMAEVQPAQLKQGLLRVDDPNVLTLFEA
eukprot:TRINITY_DN14950_c0_g1_i1.p1 TRINITY_DN14950_c0_g1~~TRINITY_DN14950_c0_g1_i1.p1  ORF type:complete len:495 (+),score=134.03 TRINITY_DN14950_c0_g1_i1:194-1678(+)